MALAVLPQSSSAVTPPLDVRVVVRGQAPSEVPVQAIVERDDRNRSIEFIVNADQYYASSVKQLDRERAARTNEARFPDLPAGSYEIRVNLWGADGIRGRAVWRGTL